MCTVLVLETDEGFQAKLEKLAQEIGDKEGRLDICITGHGGSPSPSECLDYPPEVFQKVSRAINRRSTNIAKNDAHRHSTPIRWALCM